MNALIRQHIIVLAEHWEGGESDPPSLVLDLSDGHVLRIRWDDDYQCRNLLLYTPADDYQSCVHVTGEQTGLTPEVLWPLAEKVRLAVYDWCREVDERSDRADTWEEHRGER